MFWGDFLLEKSSCSNHREKKTISKYFDAVAFPQKQKCHKKYFSSFDAKKNSKQSI